MQKSTIGIQNFNEDQICKQGNHIPRNPRILKSHLFMLSRTKNLGIAILCVKCTHMNILQNGFQCNVTCGETVYLESNMWILVAFICL
jgi:hypothetical protein